ncbi:MAG: hypothetical protein AAF806_05665 [Bacteroidota bacterium]
MVQYLAAISYAAQRLRISILLIRCLILALFFFYAISSMAQATNVKAKLNKAQDQFIVTYDLDKREAGFWDIRIIAFIDEIRIDPSRAALSGDQGLSVEAGKNKRIRWEAYTDVESIDGWVRFEVWASPTPLNIPAPRPTDWIVGSGVTTLGLGLLASGIPNLLKEEKIDANVLPESDPIIYYQTFCDPSSPHFDATQVIPEQAGQASTCDAHFLAAEQSYRAASTRTIVGSGLVVVGGLLLITKPFYRRVQLPKYLKNYGITVTPNFQLDTNGHSTPLAATATLKLTYGF